MLYFIFLLISLKLLVSHLILLTIPLLFFCIFSTSSDYIFLFFFFLIIRPPPKSPLFPYPPLSRSPAGGPFFAAGGGDPPPAVVRDHHAVGVRRIDPHVVVVPAGLEAGAPERLAAVARHAEPHRHEVEPLFVVGRNGEAHVVRRALRHVVVA